MKLLPVAVLLSLSLGCRAAQVSTETTGTTELSAMPIAVPSPGEPVHLSAGVLMSSLRTRVLPVDPEEARCRHVGGPVVTHVIVATDGTVRRAEAISGPAILRQPYVDAIRRWTFQRFLLNGQPVEVDSTVTLSMSMNGDGCAWNGRPT